MSEQTMPTAEAGVEVEAASSGEDERASYELAFHVLPTVVEGEVPAVALEINTLITKAGGEIIEEEAPERFDLAYDIVKYLEGKNRTFSSAYFGWVRFKANPSAVGAIDDEVGARGDILRHLLIRLTRQEEAQPFRFHEALASIKQVANVGERSDAAPEDIPAESVTDAAPEEKKDEA